jgi:SpoVK/Ycf46/Vps4 family AAA+-type ATPase
MVEVSCAVSFVDRSRLSFVLACCSGQVIVIGATNRPDSVDPALRRPGRFDREFYFPLPNKEARKKIISINTRKWDPPLEDGFLNELAGVTKGYGGADLRVSAVIDPLRDYP